MVAATSLDIPSVPISAVQNRMHRYWDPFQRNPHIFVCAVSGGGKSHLIRYGILPVREYSRQVIIDMKADRDSVWEGCGTTVTELPPAFSNTGDGTVSSRYRLVVDRSDPQRQIKRALQQIKDEGHCVVVIDESRSITEREQLGLGSLVENLILEGRSSGISMVIGAQSTAWAVSAVKDQPTTFFVGLTGGMSQAGELAKITGFGRELAPVIARIPGRRWLYGDRWEDEPLLAMTGM
jgi:hypothetical protein